jgi:hypothetical protein
VPSLHESKAEHKRAELVSVASQAQEAIEIDTEDDALPPSRQGKKPMAKPAKAKAPKARMSLKVTPPVDDDAMDVDTASPLPAPVAALAPLAGSSDLPPVLPHELNAPAQSRKTRRALSSSSPVDLTLKAEVAAAITLLDRSVVTAHLWGVLNRVPFPNEVLASAGATMISSSHPDIAATETARQWREDARTYRGAVDRALQEVRAVEATSGRDGTVEESRAAPAQFMRTPTSDRDRSAEASLKRVRAEATGQAAPQASSSSVPQALARKRRRRRQSDPPAAS